MQVGKWALTPESKTSDDSNRGLFCTILTITPKFALLCFKY